MNAHFWRERINVMINEGVGCGKAFGDDCTFSLGQNTCKENTKMIENSRCETIPCRIGQAGRCLSGLVARLHRLFP